MTWTIPNILTVMRLAAAPAVAFLFILLPRPFADWFALGLFIAAALTDYVDGYLARAWNQQTKLGTMLDPIADKAMVVIAIAVLLGHSSLGPWILVPGTIILFREVFVSGLREYLGDTAGTLRVTKLAKWKTLVQMVAIAVLLAQGIFEHYFGMRTWGMDADMVQQVLAGQVEDLGGLRMLVTGDTLTTWAGLGLIWLAGALTFVTGVDYFRKAQPYLKEPG
ncbi:MAG: CDP-diacylglycerol--glycerol-3-phosphate 3-phosphatidyltransferase [Pseudomonadota bacterium]